MSWDSLIEHFKNVAEMKDYYLLSAHDTLVLHTMVNAKDWCVAENIDLREISLQEIAKRMNLIPEPDTEDARKFLNLCEKRKAFMEEQTENPTIKKKYHDALNLIEERIRKQRAIMKEVLTAYENPTKSNKIG